MTCMISPRNVHVYLNTLSPINMQDIIWYILYTYIYICKMMACLYLSWFFLSQIKPVFFCVLSSLTHWKVDQVLDEEHGEKWEVLRQSLRAVLHRTSSRVVEVDSWSLLELLSYYVTWHLWCPHMMSWLSLSYIIIMSVWYSYLSLRWKNFTWNSQKRWAVAQRSAERRTLPDCVELTQVIPIVMVSVTSSHVFFVWAKPDKTLFSPYLSFLLHLFCGANSCWFMWIKLIHQLLL